MNFILGMTLIIGLLFFLAGSSTRLVRNIAWGIILALLVPLVLLYILAGPK